MESHWQAIPLQARAGFLEAHWRPARRAAEYLEASLGEKGLHRSAYDLWETFRGSFTYSHAAIYAALLSASSLAAARGEGGLEGRWRGLAQKVKAACLEKFWVGRYFARGLRDGRLDRTVDSSILGTVEPFGLLCLEEDSERAMAEACVETVVRRLGLRMAGGVAIKRFEGDPYIPGAAGGVNTLWLSRVMLLLALHYCGHEPMRAREYRERALGHIRVVMSRATETGLLPELLIPDFPSRWAAPHGWGMASFLRCMFLLDRLDRRLGLGGGSA